MLKLTQKQARHLWIQAQKLDVTEPFGAGPEATRAATEHLGYVQIDTINVIERCHHHILYTRIPEYRLSDLTHAQSRDKSVFEYWTHALSYVPTRDFRFFMGEMKRTKREPGRYLSMVKKHELAKVMRLIRKSGAISIRDVVDDVLIEKDYEWASRKPSKKALQLGFYAGTLVISERLGMLKKYELAERHFDWIEKPKAAREREVNDYLLDRALRAQAVVSLDSICHLRPSHKPVMEATIGRRQDVVEVQVAGAEKIRHWLRPEILDDRELHEERTHILSPFDPLVIQRKRSKLFLDYFHLFEAYLPKEKRVFGYFGLPVLIGDEIVAVLDLKTDRAAGKLRLQKWTWLPKARSAERKRQIEEALTRFERFQLGR